MKKNLTTLLGLFLTLTLVFSGCKDKGEDNKPEDEVRTELLSNGTWNVQAVTRNSSENVTSSYTGMTVTFNENGTYVATTPDAFSEVWPKNGNWEYASNNNTPDINTIIRNPDVSGGVEMNLSDVTESTLTVSFTISEPPSGARMMGISGNFVFEFTR
ncbi:hypothetical protein OO013_03025 [Mangrovivirga sp. M17]|uniref:Lipocalin-like domain-containing protein n=1 Tax=Mangrovivirga halotolerans TaxID=2993936 RepID=A0ABT3RMX4_9BACT|nr:hypothetical protein [Mangrovivirga halotolerans]MCX2742821.1 hypothetical protein [Mangrovivirga halotolerans]